MATLSEDEHSWKASGVKRRDFRSVKNGPETPKRGGMKRRKNTKKWCRGKPGKEHDIKHMKHPTYGSYHCHVDKCVECGKEVKLYWLGGWWHKDGPKSCPKCYK